jgi:argininosuccinate lyase
MTGALSTATFNSERMKRAAYEDYSNATDLADYLVARGLPFREAHRVVGEVVSKCIADDRLLSELKSDELAEFHPLLDAGGDEVQELLDPVNCVARRKTHHGTAPDSVQGQLECAQQRLQAKHEALENLNREEKG